MGQPSTKPMKNGKTQGRPVWAVTAGSYYMGVQGSRVRPPDTTWTVILADQLRQSCLEDSE